MTRPMLTQREAAAACGVSRSTIRRRREAGELPGSVEDPVRGWMIPVDALLAAGFRLNAPAPPDSDTSPAPEAGSGAAPGGGQDAAALRAELDRVRAEHALALAEAQFEQRLAAAEVGHLRAQLAERGERIADLQRAVAALTPAPARDVLAPGADGMGVPEQGGSELARDESEGRRPWWGGRP
ncbi:helix-turn-helix transcriptional regulator [Streptomyces erythrochromogenes]|uniref:helix-turn-helix transcriptional regulator n=1 Tax=Streptomyces erythrochromogenes TaxID=285574 RepID=UPI0036A7C991